MLSVIQVESQTVDSIFSIARVAYRSHSTPFAELRQLVLDFVANTRYLFSRDEYFLQLLREVPGFSVDLFELLMTNEWDYRGGVLASTLPTQCSSCLRSSNFYPLTWFSRVEYGRFEVAGLCLDCNHAHRQFEGRLNTAGTSHSEETAVVMVQGNEFLSWRDYGSRQYILH